jgi:hypothetical protein
MRTHLICQACEYNGCTLDTLLCAAVARAEGGEAEVTGTLGWYQMRWASSIAATRVWVVFACSRVSGRI